MRRYITYLASAFIALSTVSCYTHSHHPHRHHPHGHGHLPPGQAKKIYGDKSAKKHAPGQKKKSHKKHRH